VVALVTSNWLKSKWCFVEMIQAREKGKPIFPVKLESCELPGILTGIQSIDLTVDKEIGYRRLAAGLKQQGLDPADVFIWNPERPSYPGFPAFEEADAAVFLGRSAEIFSARETEGLRRHSRDVPRLVLVLGSSGSGKSSLVRAGLIPRLKKDEKNWLHHFVRRMSLARLMRSRSRSRTPTRTLVSPVKVIRFAVVSTALPSLLRSMAESF
jgi:hypothetical protein